MIVVRVRHIRAARLCLRGGRQWFADRGLDWNSFLANGLPADEVRAFHDEFANRVLAEAEREGNAA